MEKYRIRLDLYSYYSHSFTLYLRVLKNGKGDKR